MSWESAIPILCVDERYKILDHQQRKQVFEEFIYNIAKEKKIVKKQKLEDENQHQQETIKNESDSKDFGSFISLLKELNYLNKDSKWSDVHNKIKNDPRCQSISMEELEKEFYNYIFENFENKKEENDLEAFEALIYPKIGLKNQWDDIRDQFYHLETEFDKEDVFYQLQKEKIEEYKNQFLELLIQTSKDTKLLHKGTPTMGKKFNDLKKHLSQDQRYKQLIDLEDDRDRILIEYIRSLNK